MAVAVYANFCECIFKHFSLCLIIFEYNFVGTHSFVQTYIFSCLTPWQKLEGIKALKTKKAHARFCTTLNNEMMTMIMILMGTMMRMIKAIELYDSMDKSGNC